ncbi:tegument protein VP11/12 [Bovine alphaherpesvirus 2]|uniref:Tegument protein VP11/12 n=1 Tax=Bovine alphaherpesvirus 2 TaxID=10295 RepID=A0A7T1L7K6_9ALPH|nr:tegument protein VP11/12 [Bovine alphaherpesvirus 2]
MRRGVSSPVRPRQRFTGAACSPPRTAMPVRDRIVRSCLLPTTDALISAAVNALRQRADSLQPPFLTSAARCSRLATRRHNAVPESIIADGIASDPNYQYVRHYASAAVQALEDTSLSDRAVWQGILDQYWKHLRAIVGDAVSLPEPTQGGVDPGLHVLFKPTLSAKLLTKAQFKGATLTARFTSAVSGLREAAHRVQQYLFFMRPEDPGSPSEDTAHRLDELLAYVITLYRWAEWLLCITDKYVIRQLCPARLADAGPVAPTPPADLFEQHFRQGSAATTSNGTQYMVLRATISDMFGYLRRLSNLWEGGKRNGGGYGTAEAIVSSVEVLSIVHHHAQYLINATLAGYVVWVEGGVDSRRLRAAVAAQDRFCRGAAPIFPATTTSSWARMEMSIQAWFTANLASVFFRDGGPSAHYEAALSMLAAHPTAPETEPELEVEAVGLASAPITLGGEAVAPLAELRRAVRPCDEGNPPTHREYVRGRQPPALPPRNGQGRQRAYVDMAAAPPPRRGVRAAPAACVAAEDPYMLPEDVRIPYRNQLPAAGPVDEDRDDASAPYRAQQPADEGYDDQHTIYRRQHPGPRNDARCEDRGEARFMECAIYQSQGPDNLSPPYATIDDHEDAVYADPHDVIPPLRAAAEARAPELPVGHPRRGPHRQRSRVALPGGEENVAAISAMLTKLARDRASRR